MTLVTKRSILIGLCGAALVTSSLACSLLTPTQTKPTAQWTPSGAPASTATSAAILPTTVATKAAPIVITPDPTVARSAAPAVVAPTGPQKVVITEADIATLFPGGTVTQSGASIEGMNVRFIGGKTQVTATHVAAGPVAVNNLVMIGQLVAKDGSLQFESESISPGGLVSAVLPALVNQAFRQFTSRWTIDSVQTTDGKVELTVR